MIKKSQTSFQNGYFGGKKLFHMAIWTYVMMHSCGALTQTYTTTTLSTPSFAFHNPSDGHSDNSFPIRDFLSLLASFFKSDAQNNVYAGNPMPTPENAPVIQTNVNTDPLLEEQEIFQNIQKKREDEESFQRALEEGKAQREKEIQEEQEQSRRQQEIENFQRMQKKIQEEQEQYRRQQEIENFQRMQKEKDFISTNASPHQKNPFGPYILPALLLAGGVGVASWLYQTFKDKKKKLRPKQIMPSNYKVIKDTMHRLGNYYK